MSEQAALMQAVEAIKKGAVIAYATEGVYGLGCDPFQQQAVLRLLALKQRPIEMGVILVAAHLAQVEPLIAWEAIPLAQQQTIQQSWPGAVTWVVPATDKVPSWITGGRETVAVRVSGHPTVQQLCQAFGGPLVSTSANRNGEAPALDCQQVQQTFPNILCVQGALTTPNQPSAIYDAPSGQKIR
ncbi:L-threonylcarbamoyladenylate synthase [Galenea microaerophila]